MADTVSPGYHTGARVYPDGNAIIIGGRQSGDTNDRFQLRADGQMRTGLGTNPPVPPDDAAFRIMQDGTYAVLEPMLASASSGVTAVDSTLYLSYFTADVTGTALGVYICTGGTAAVFSGTTYFVMGLHTLAANNRSLAAIAAQTADKGGTASWLGSTFSAYYGAFTASVGITPGTRYAISATYRNTTGTHPVFYTCGNNMLSVGGAVGATGSDTPVTLNVAKAHSVGSTTSIPSTLTVSSNGAANTSVPWFGLLVQLG